MSDALDVGPAGSLTPIAGAGNGALVKDCTDASFTADVLDASREVPIIVDLWAPWCGPCKTLGPTLEKIVNAAGGAVRLVKVNIDENREVARQLKVRSIPAVYAFKDGQPIDGFVGAVTERHVKDFVKSLSASAGPSLAETMIAEADAARTDGDSATAAVLYAQALEAGPGDPKALAGLAHCYLDSGDLERAHQTLEMVPPDQENHASVRSAQAVLTLKETATATVSEGGQALEVRVGADENDHQARFDLSAVYVDAGRRSEAVDHLLEIVKRDRNWNEEAARKQLVTLFEAFGPANDVTIDGRRRLSSILFA